jgi:CHAT domain-containing protein/tetratricopeptide (TPR) repeat protein
VTQAEFHYLDDAGWDRLIQNSPDAALARVRGALEEGPLPSVDRARLLRVAARAQMDLGRIEAASLAAREAVRLLDDTADRGVRLAVLMTSAIVLAEAGDIAAALGSLSVLEQECDGTVLGRVRLQQAYVLQHAGRLPEALAALDHSDRLFATDGSDEERFRVHLNRGLVLLQRGDLMAAEADFAAAADLAHQLGMTAAEGQCHANAGVLYGRSRRLLEALRAFDTAAELLHSAGRPDRVSTWMEIDRAETMMHFGLVHDAVASAHRALSIARPSGNAMLVGDALLMCARTELRAGLVTQAAHTAVAARDHLLATGRTDMVVHAESVRVHALLQAATDTTSADAFDRSAHIVGRLRELGWHEQADDLAAERLRTAWRLGTWAPVVDDVAELRLHAFGARRDLALLGWFAEAVARCLRGDGRGSVEACTRGLDFLDDITAEATDLEARSAAMRLGHDLSRWIIEVAIGLDDADLALAASEGTRARGLHEELDGRDRHRPLTDEGAERLRAELRGRLQNRCLVQWVVAGDRVHAVVCDEHANRLVDVADLRSVIRERDRLMVWLDRAAVEPDESSQRALRAARLLDELLLAPLDLASRHSVVIVPVDELHGVPWSGLPSIAERPVVLAPSSRLWLDADRRSSIRVRTAGFVAGPDLAADDVERAALRACYPQVDEATGAGATSATVRTMFGSHDLVHVAAHGRFRADRPLLSTFQLSEGEVTLHDSVPDRVATRLAVLSSCEGGAHQGTGGSEVLGLASVLLARGAASVLAPLTVVRDLECGEFVSAVHAAMARGERFAAAVASVRSAWLRDDDLSRWAVASSFNCFGSGATHVTAAPTR